MCIRDSPSFCASFVCRAARAGVRSGGVFITDSAPGESIRRKSGGFGPGALTDYNLSEFVARPPICCGKSLPKAGFEPEAGKNDGPLPEERPVSVNTLMVVGIYFLRWMLSETVSTVQGPPYVTLAAVEALIFRRPEHQTSALA